MLKDRLIIFSGGMDSFCLWWTEKNNLNSSWLHIPRTNHPGTLAVKDFVVTKELKLQNRGKISKSISADDVYTENGGFFLVALAAGQEGPDEVLFGFNLEDNSFEGIELTAVEFEFIASRAAGKRVNFIAPFAKLTKADMLKKTLEEDCPPELILKTWSCLRETKLSIHCGSCRNCIERWIALTENNLTDIWQNNPWESEYVSNVLKHNEEDRPYKKRLLHALSLQESS